MFRYLFIIAMGCHCLINSGNCYNGKMLESEARSCLSKISQGYHIPKKIIKEKLDFLHDSDLDTIKKKYKQASFEDFYRENLQSALKDKRVHSEFTDFERSCRELYEEETTERVRVAVLMLFEEVSEKYLDTLSRVNKIEQYKALGEKRTSF